MFAKSEASHGPRRKIRGTALCVCSVVLLPFTLLLAMQGGSGPTDPGVRGGEIDAGQPLSSLSQTPGAPEFFANALARFQEVEVVTGGTNNGLGPRFNGNQCSSCHAQPAVGGSSPSETAFPFIGPNPETVVYDLDGAQNTLPPFITADGPVREARFKFYLNPDGSLSNNPDGNVHDLFVISGRSDAGSCQIQQPNYEQNLALNNVSFRIPTPLFGDGLIENISDETILANLRANASNPLGIAGQPNHNGNDGSISRFGWKAQNKSLLMFAGEAYNVEMGITNELFPSERPDPDEEQWPNTGLPANCLLNATPEDTTNFSVPAISDPAAQNAQVPSDIVQFAMFMRLLAPPTPSTTTPGGAASIQNGRQDFMNVGCGVCHTPTLMTSNSGFNSGLNNVPANLFSDLLVHHMGSNLADGISQGSAGPDQFRTAPLWGLGQRIFFLHDGRTTDLLDAIEQHASTGSEANAVIQNFNQNLTDSQKQDLLNFLRSL